MRESEIISLIRKALTAEPGVALWRNNTGMLKDNAGMAVRYGLCRGSADLVGIVKTRSGVGRFFALEVKAPGAKTARRREQEQTMFLALVNSMGGHAECVRSVDEALTALMRARRK